MDFSNRNVQSQAVAPGGQPTTAGNQGPANSKKSAQDDEKSKLIRIITVVLVAAIVIILCAVIAIVNNENNDGKVDAQNLEAGFVKSDKLQAVFLNTGQVYFGKIKELNTKYFVVSNIYYLQTANGAAGDNKANTNVSLVKLGCELHEPLDQMVINRDQVTFWENLGDNGQVAKAVAAFQKQNPNGQKCVDQSTSSGATSNSAQPATPNNGATPTTNNSGR